MFAFNMCAALLAYPSLCINAYTLVLSFEATQMVISNVALTMAASYPLDSLKRGMQTFHESISILLTRCSSCHTHVELCRMAVTAPTLQALLSLCLCSHRSAHLGGLYCVSLLSYLLLLLRHPIASFRNLCGAHLNPSHLPRLDGHLSASVTLWVCQYQQCSHCN
jgi:hypothetical protein